MIDVSVLVVGAGLILTVEMEVTVSVTCRVTVGESTVATLIFGGRVATTVFTTVRTESSEDLLLPVPDPDPPGEPAPPFIGTTEYRGTRGNFSCCCGATNGSEVDNAQRCKDARRTEAGISERILNTG